MTYRFVVSFVIRNPDRNLLLRAATANERDMWIRAVASQADRARGGKGTSIIFDPRLTHIANGMSGSTKGGVSLERKLEEAIRQLGELHILFLICSSSIMFIHLHAGV